VAIAQIALPVAAGQLFDYWVPDGLAIAAGDIVRVRLGARRHHGVVVALDATSSFLDRLQPIEALAGMPRVPADVMELATFIGAYYHAAPGMAYALATPPGTRARRRAEAQVDVEPARAAPYALNDAQAELKKVSTAPKS